MAVNIAKEIRQSLGWSLTQADQQLNLANGTWQRIEQRQIKLSLKQFFALGLKALRATFGAVVLTEQQINSYNAEMEKLNGLMLILQQNADNPELLTQLQKASIALARANSFITKQPA
jgi:hypothetical protein